MEALEHPSPLVAFINLLLSPLHIHVPDHLVFVALITLFILFIGLAIRSTLSVDKPGKLQIILEDVVTFIVGVLEGNMGPKGRNYLPLLGTIFVFILIGNLMGQIPGLGSPTSNINVPFACAITLWLYYHWQGIRANGLFGNIFGEHLVVLIIASIIPFILPLPIQFLGLIVGPLQAFIFLTLGAIYRRRQRTSMIMGMRWAGPRAVTRTPSRTNQRFQGFQRFQTFQGHCSDGF